MFAMRRSAAMASSPACMSAESSTYHVLSTGTGPPGGAGSMTGCVLASAATAMTMSAIGIHVSGPSTVPWPVPWSCLCTPPAPSTSSQVSPAAVTVVFAECKSMSSSIS